MNKVLITFLAGINMTSIAFGQYDANMNLWINNLDQAKLIPERVYKLDLSNQSLDAIPEIIESFKNLRLLKLSDNNISSIDGRLDNLTKLEYIELSGNRIKELNFNEFRGSRFTLDELWVRNNRLREVDSSLNILSNLSILNLGSNQIKLLPAYLDLSRLVNLQLDDNQFTSLPPSIAQAVKLKILNLYGNHLSEFVMPNSFRNLKMLNIGDNPVDTIDFGGQRLKLEMLILDWIPVEAFNLAKLPPTIKVLSIEHCGLKTIDGLLHLKNLEELSIIQNEVQSIPNEIQNLKKLRKFWIGGNPVSDTANIPASVEVIK